MHIPGFVWFIAILIIAYFVLAKMDILPSFKNIFQAKKTAIDNTPIVITQMKSIAQLMTISSYDEVVVDSTKKTLLQLPGLINQPIIPQNSSLVIIAQGQIIAGIDLSEIQQKDVYVRDDSVAIKLPPPKILDVIVNPSQYEIFIEEGGWLPDEVSNLKVKAKQIMIDRFLNNGTLAKANQQAAMIMENFLRTSGFKKVTLY